VLGGNLWGVINGIKTFTPLMLQWATDDTSYQGHIINTASIAGLINSPMMGLYNVSKHAVVSLSESLYQDLQLVKKAVSCSVLCPYFMPTGIAQSEQHRPNQFINSSSPTNSQRLSQSMTEKAIADGTATPNEVAVKTYEAIRHGQFYIYSDLNPLTNVQTRLTDVIEARNPGDPFAHMPQVRKFMEAKLRRA
jgi:short-subunit dehydrogenase